MSATSTIADAASLARMFAPQERTFARLLARQAERYGDRPLIVIDDTTLTYRSVIDLAARWASTLAAAGVTPGDRIALICSNRVEFLAVYFGCIWLGAVAVPINTASRGVQLEYILRHSGARLLVIEAELIPSLLTVTDPALLSKDIWVIGDAKGQGADRLVLRPMPPAGEPRECSSLQTRRHGRHPLYFGHDRAIQRRLLSASAILLVGRADRGTSGHARGRRPADVASAIPYERVELLLSGVSDRLDNRH